MTDPTKIQFVDLPTAAERMEAFTVVVKPLMEWMNNNGLHPHHTIVVTQTSAEILEGRQFFKTMEFVKD